MSANHRVRATERSSRATRQAAQAENRSGTARCRRGLPRLCPASGARTELPYEQRHFSPRADTAPATPGPRPLAPAPDGPPAARALRRSPCGPASRRGGGCACPGKPSGRAQLALDQGTGGLRLLLGVELPDCLIDDLGVHALGAQFTGECLAGQPPAVVPGLDPGVGEGGIVDQPDLLETGEDLLGRVIGDLPFAQSVGELLRVRGVPVSSRRQMARARSTGSRSASTPAPPGACCTSAPVFALVTVPLAQVGAPVRLLAGTLPSVVTRAANRVTHGGEPGAVIPLRPSTKWDHRRLRVPATGFAASRISSSRQRTWQPWPSVPMRTPTWVLRRPLGPSMPRLRRRRRAHPWAPPAARRRRASP